MRKVRNITVAVDPELYRQTRRLAAEYDTNVTEMVRYLLLAMPEALKAARFPGGCPQFGIAAARAVSATPPTALSVPQAAPTSASRVAPVPDPTPHTPPPTQVQQNPQKPPVPL
jgi:hypothetical protein